MSAAIIREKLKDNKSTFQIVSKHSWNFEAHKTAYTTDPICSQSNKMCNRMTDSFKYMLHQMENLPLTFLPVNGSHYSYS